jgi:hypothetical protein
MPKTHSIGDCNTAGGGCITSTPQGSVYENNSLIAVNGSKGTADSACNNNNIHCTGNWSTTGGGPTVFAEGTPINKEGDPDTCGHYRTGGSPNVYNDAFQGGGAMFDNNPPFNPDTIPPEAQPSPPAGYENITTATIYVFENDEEEHAGNGPPPGVEYSPMEQVDEDIIPQPAPYVPTTSPCTIEIEEETPPYNLIEVPFTDLPEDFTWATGSPLPTFPDWAAMTPLSPNFTVWDMCNGAVGRYMFSESAIQNNGLSQKQILINMCHHANIVLEPMLAAYGLFVITSGFRNKTGTSQHNKGQATDIQFTNFHTSNRTYDAKMEVRQKYYDRAKDIRDTLEFDQLILEYFGTNPWIHISSNPATHREKVLTQVSSSPSYSSGLILLG